MSLCTTAHPLCTRFANIYSVSGASFSESTRCNATEPWAHGAPRAVRHLRHDLARLADGEDVLEATQTAGWPESWAKFRPLIRRGSQSKRCCVGRVGSRTVNKCSDPIIPSDQLTRAAILLTQVGPTVTLSGPLGTPSRAPWICLLGCSPVRESAIGWVGNAPAPVPDLLARM